MHDANVKMWTSMEMLDLSYALVCMLCFAAPPYFKGIVDYVLYAHIKVRIQTKDLVWVFLLQ